MVRRNSLTDLEKARYLKAYEKNEGAHNEVHIAQVREAAKRIADSIAYKGSREVLDTAALLHDRASGTNRATHDTVGAALTRKDPILAKRFSAAQVEAIAHAIEAHRASNKALTPRSTLARIVRDADRTDARFDRAYYYGKHHFPEMSDEDALRRAAAHLYTKYGPDSKLTYHFPETKKEIQRRHAATFAAHKSQDINQLRALLKESALRDILRLFL